MEGGEWRGGGRVRGGELRREEGRMKDRAMQVSNFKEVKTNPERQTHYVILGGDPLRPTQDLHRSHKQQSTISKLQPDLQPINSVRPW